MMHNGDKLSTALSLLYESAANGTLTLTKAKPLLQEFARERYIPDAKREELITATIDQLSATEKPHAWLEVYSCTKDANPNRATTFVNNAFASLDQLTPELQYHGACAIHNGPHADARVANRASAVLNDLRDHSLSDFADKMRGLRTAENA